jgi:hypothetical protein
MNTNNPNNNYSQRIGLLFLVILFGLFARLDMATLGWNYDMSSYRIVAGILDQGGNVYASTERYNYGPFWFLILHGLDLLAGHNQVVFRYLVAGFLSLIDVGICLFLWRRFGLLAAGAFFLNPISILITGYHSQFDNLAIFLGLLAAQWLGDGWDQPVNCRKFFALVLLGLSIATKHILFAFPFWLAVKQRGSWQKLIVILVPVLIFLAGFAPYWPTGKQGIIHNVFHYHSETNEYFYNLFVPHFLQDVFSSRAIWFICIAIFAFIYRRANTVEYLLAYTCVLVAASPAIMNQYLVIPVAFLATRWSVLPALYTIVATWMLLGPPNGPLAVGYLPLMPPAIPVGTLCFTLAWITWRPNIITGFQFLRRKCVAEFKNQLGIGE